MRPSKICISICAAVSLLWSATAMAQSTGKAATVAANLSSGGEQKQTTHVEVSLDALGAVQRAVSSYGQYEAAVRLNLKDKYFPVVELGLGDADKEEETSKLHYTTSAPYARVGIDLNMLKNKHDDYRVYVGIRAAYTSFKYDLTSTETITDPVWGTDVSINATGQSCSYLWGELVAGVQARIIGPVHLGWSMRYKSRLSQKTADAGEPWYVPGFGKRGGSRLGGTFNIIVAF